MTMGLYTVQEGDTLSHIAQRFGIRIAEMQGLNPFINNPNYIRTGWVLRVPERAGVPASDDATATPEPPLVEALQLNSIAAPPEHGTVDFCSEQRRKNATHYADLIYEVGQNRFWLLREHTLPTLIEAADDLKKKLLTSDPDSRISALNNAGLLEPFLEPKVSSFLDAQDSQRYLQIEYELTVIRAEIEKVQTPTTAQNGTNIDNTPHVSPEQLRMTGERQRDDEKLSREFAALDTKAHKIALKRGYKFKDDRLYSAEALKAREIIQRYLKQRQTLLDEGAKHFSPQEIEQLSQDHATLLAELESPSREFTSRLPDTAEWLRSSTTKFHYSELVKTLLEAAAYGLALPEYALKADNEGIQQDFKKYEEYHSWLRQKTAVEQSAQASVENWINVAKQQPPSNLFNAEQEQWRALESKEQELKRKAKDFVQNAKPGRHLLWNPETFVPQPQQRLMRADFPLREISVPTEVTRLRHLSLTSVLKDLDRRAQALLKEDLKNALTHAKKLSIDVKTGDKTTDPDLFSTWLTMHDARPLEIQDSWFDRHGFFLPEALKRHIKTEKIHIENLRDDATFDAWGKDLRLMLFKQSTLGPLRLFDNSPQARLIRCLSPPQSKVQLGTDVTAPNISMKKILGASAEVTMDINLAQGEIDIAKFEVPGRATAEATTLKYSSENKWSEPVNFGTFCLTGSIKAWGFAGASMMLSANLRLGPNKQENNAICLDIGRDAERRLSHAETGLKPYIRHNDLLGADFDLFAGAPAGIKISGSLLWKPPCDLLTLRRPLVKKTTKDDSWLELALLGIDAGAASGASDKAGLQLSLQNGYVILHINAAVIAGPGVAGVFNFIVGYKAIVQILNIFNKALIENSYKEMTWVDPETFAYLSKLQRLSTLGVDVEWLFLRGYDVVSRMYETVKLRPQKATSIP
ncbi:LysM domain-containing protein [Pseudomonas sp.]|uniref:LysM peptidoglycan-binding domain-containing protein n=1 Tax=Pseudomonas sp. TaxID=306 RepID=UPI00262B71C4|nr:LysM domain-containing protein [Pseudomonas sp.]